MIKIMNAHPYPQDKECDIILLVYFLKKFLYY